jgi:hypothetical protein
MLSYRHHITTIILLSSLVLQAQPPAKIGYKQNVLSIAYYIESANNSINSLNGLLKKDNYRNKITSLNNPTNNELGFSLKNEILTALKPLLAKAKKTDSKKFKDVIENFLNNPEENGISSVKKYLPALGIFSTVLSLVGNLVVTEKTITREDLNEFTAKIQQFFIQYEKLNAINEQFAVEVQKLIERSEEAKEDLRVFLIECITSMNSSSTKQDVKDLKVEVLIQKYYDPQKLQTWLDTCQFESNNHLYPPDAPTSVKLLTSQIKKLQKEFEAVYYENYSQLKNLIASLKTAIVNIDQDQVNKTTTEIEKLYNESRQADLINLNINQVDERMNTVCRNINSGK